MLILPPCPTSFFFTEPPPPAIYTLSLHDALPISCSPRTRDPCPARSPPCHAGCCRRPPPAPAARPARPRSRSEEHTSELQSHSDLVCRLLLEKKNKQKPNRINKQRVTPGSATEHK